MDTESPLCSPTRDPKVVPPLNTKKGEGVIDLGEKEFSPLKERDPIRQMGPPLKGVPRPLEAFPPDMPEGARAEFNSLMDQKDRVLALLDPIMAQMEALKISKHTTAPVKSAPVPSSAPHVIGREAVASNPQGEQRRKQKRVAPVAPTAKAERP